MLREDYNLPLVKSFEISEMSLSDLQEVLEIENLSFATPWSKEFFLKEILSEFSKIFVAHSSHLGLRRVLGYIYLWFVGEEMHILNLACHPEYNEKKYAFVHFDGPHMTRDVLTEAVWFANRAAGSCRFVFDDYPKYDMQLVSNCLKPFGFRPMQQGNNKICLEKNETK